MPSAPQIRNDIAEYVTDITCKMNTAWHDDQPANANPPGFFGIRVHWEVTVNYRRCPRGMTVEQRMCKLEYLETSNYIPARVNARPDVEYDSYILLPDAATFKPWNDRPFVNNKPVTPGNSLTMLLKDETSRPKAGVGSNSYLNIHLRISNATAAGLEYSGFHAFWSGNYKWVAAGGGLGHDVHGTIGTKEKFTT